MTTTLRRLTATLRRDTLLQWRNGFYYAGGFFILVWGALLSLAPDPSRLDPGGVMPALLCLNLVLTTFYFVAGMVLLEKAEGSLQALVATPLRDAEYLASKAATLTLLGAVESLVILLPVFGLPRSWGGLLAGVLLLGVFYTLLGFAFVARYDAVNTFLIPSVGMILFLMLPLLDHFDLAAHPAWLLHPVQPFLALLRAAFEPASAFDWAYGLLGSLGWTAAAALTARRRFHRFVLRPA